MILIVLLILPDDRRVQEGIMSKIRIMSRKADGLLIVAEKAECPQ